LFGLDLNAVDPLRAGLRPLIEFTQIRRSRGQRCHDPTSSFQIVNDRPRKL
jgi:hypothetical protein